MTAALIPLKHLAVLNPETLGEDTDPDRTFRYIDIGNTGRGTLLREPQLMRFEESPSRARRVLRPGDTILSTVRTYLRAVWTLREPKFDLVASTGFVCLRPRARVDPRFLGWLAQADPVVEEVVERSVGVSYPAVNPSDVGGIKVRCPSVSAQRVIADYLDRETALIDAVIQSRRRVVGLLNERTTAFIEDAVADTDWPRIPLRRVIRKIDQGWSPQCDARVPAENEWGVLKVGCVNGGRFNTNEIKALPPEVPPRREYLVRDGDLLMSRANTRELVGSVALVEGVRPRTLLCDKLYRIELDRGKATPEFACLWMQTRAVRGQLELQATGASDSMQNIGQDTVRELVIPLPTLAEQRDFVARSRYERDRLGPLADTMRRQIDLLLERRQALITATITGQLDAPGAA